MTVAGRAWRRTTDGRPIADAAFGAKTGEGVQCLCWVSRHGQGVALDETRTLARGRTSFHRQSFGGLHIPPGTVLLASGPRADCEVRGETTTWRPREQIPSQSTSPARPPG